ncbi:MAG TPA: hypothetical protein VGZ00_00960 [Candidatus Baltobacteraceae bacterium]|nr:hypothetical protein [Candidatus Baltobacteraceae bacterium]
MKIVPLISSSVMGPLGISHLPRLWLKILLYAVDALPDGYRHGSGGFDEQVCTNLGIDSQAMIAFVEDEKPDYLRFEAWIKAHATKLTPEAVFWHNLAIRTGRMRDELAAERRSTFGITDPNIANGVTLNDLDDWAGIHAQILEQQP